MKMPDKIVSLGRKAMVKLNKHSPEILVVSGVVATVAGTVMACKATLHVEEIMNERDDTISNMEMLRDKNLDRPEEEQSYTLEMYDQDVRTLKFRTAGKLVRNYAPSAALLALGIGCFLGAYGVLKKRNIALTAAYNALTATFANYRARVVEELGKEKDQEFYYGKKEKVDVVDPETGEIVGKDLVNGEANMSPYHRFFDESSEYFVRNAEKNLFFLTQQQNWANDKLRQQGCLFLNEVYDMLGFPRTQIGALVGWVYGKDGKDQYVDFGITDASKPGVRDFVNGFENVVMLDFNVDGVIYDLL